LTRIEASPEPPPAPPQAEPKPKTEFTQGELRTYDFTGWDWRQLPHDVVKAARSGSVLGFRIVAQMECVECKRPMWTCDLSREDMCEEDEYLKRSALWDMRAARAKSNNQKPLNPFGEASERPTRLFWPLDES
jgi:hypothetical protein